MVFSCLPQYLLSEVFDCWQLISFRKWKIDLNTECIRKPEAISTYIGHCWESAQVKSSEEEQHKQLSTTTDDARVLVAQGGNHCLKATKSAVQAQSDQHQEEYNRPEDGAAHGGNRFRVDDEDEARTLQSHLID